MDLLAESITEVAVSGEIANTDRVLNIAYGIDRNFLFGAAVSMQSVVMHNPDLAVKFHLFTDYIDEDYLQRVNAFTSKNANVEVRIYKVSSAFIDIFPSLKQWSYATFFRLVAFQYLSETIENLLYIDADVICKGSLAGLLDINFDGDKFAAVIKDVPFMQEKPAKRLAIEGLPGNYLNVDRVALSASHATTAGYIILFPSLLASILILKSDFRHKTTLYTINFMLSLCAVIVTETRAAILVFPFFALLLIVMDSYINKRINYKLYCFIAIALLAGVFSFKDTLLTRMNDLNRDLVNYSHDNTRTSVGARLAMYEVGLKTYSPIGQSLEKRAEKIHELEEKEPRLSGALPFVDSHLHNDLIDTLSTRGIPGVALTILAFSAIFIYALRTAKEPYILILLFSLLVVGLSDVILFSKPVPTAVFVTIILLCAYFKVQSDQCLLDK